ncbi:hypothetical protein KGO95_02115 [Patescibacteria group bacterium]|nr:hypothetical protein [Patescibacteria group bacterium]
MKIVHSKKGVAMNQATRKRQAIRSKVLRVLSSQKKGVKLLEKLRGECKHEEVVITLYLGEVVNATAAACLVCGLEEAPGPDNPHVKFSEKNMKNARWVSNEVFRKKYSLTEKFLVAAQRSEKH